jgi:hypothetical protein
MTDYYRLDSAAKRPAVADSDWEASYRKMYPCLHRPWGVANEAMDVVVQDLGENVVLNIVSVALITIAREELLDVLRPAADKYLRFGRIFDRAGRPLPSVTLGSRDRLQMRGGPTSTCQFCPRCGIVLYYPMPKWYLLKSDITGQPLYYGSEMTSLIVETSLARKVKKRGWKKLYITKLPVLEEPLDGLPRDLRTVTPEYLQARSMK